MPATHVSDSHQASSPDAGVLPGHKSRRERLGRRERGGPGDGGRAHPAAAPDAGCCAFGQIRARTRAGSFLFTGTATDGATSSHTIRERWIWRSPDASPRLVDCRRRERPRSAVRQCREAGVPIFVKQLGRIPTCAPDERRGTEVRFDGAMKGWTLDGGRPVLLLKSAKGGDPSEWPKDLRVREFPKGRPWE